MKKSAVVPRKRLQFLLKRSNVRVLFIRVSSSGSVST
jgi:hypothetical protein